MKIKLKSQVKLVIALVLAAPQITFACEMAKALAETQFVIDPSSQKSQIESIKNNAQIEIGRCSVEDQFLFINVNTLFFQDDTSRQESVDGRLLQKNSNCSIQTEIPFQKMDTNDLQMDVLNKNKFLRQCVRLVIADSRGQKINFAAPSKCQVKSLNNNGSTVETDGVGCLVAVNLGSRLTVEPNINPDCMNSSFLNQKQIQAGDYESVIKVFPAQAEAGQFSIGQPIGQRYMRHTLLPAKNFMPRSVKENDTHFPYISAFSTNISPGNIAISAIGSQRFLIQPTFLVENLAKEYCKGSECARTSSYVTPIAGRLKLSKFNVKTGKNVQVGVWTHALKVPSNWSGLAEFKNENNMSGLAMGQLEADMKLQEGDLFELSAQFYEPRTLLDEMISNDNFLELNNNLSVGELTDDSLPSLPKVGQLGQVGRLPKMPSIGLGYKGILDLVDQLNMTHAWSQKYEMICNSQNRSCMKLSGYDKAISTIQMKFKIGQNNQVIPISVSKKSPVFESYEKTVATFAQKVCQ